MKTKAAILYGINQPLRIEELEIPKLLKGQVLVKILFSGICGSQVNEYLGAKGEDKYLPHTLGHEASGMVEEIGPGVSRFAKGDYVVLSWIKGPGLEASKCQYRSGEAIINSGAISTFSQYSVVSENRLTKIPREVSPEVAVLLGCALTTGAGMVKNTLKAKPGDTIAVFGAGGVGLSAVLFASSIGCRTVIAVDILESKLRLARDVGATHMINAKEENVLARIMELTENKGLDYAIEASGSIDMMEISFQAIRNGGTAVIAGNVKKGGKICIDPYGLINGRRIVGSWGGETQPEVDIPFYANLYLNGKLQLDRLVTHRYKLDDINLAFQDMMAGKVGRALINLM
jgi:S-(hydroxymethyl)glutathione dehydrogenase/alcohol dehydrogenase